MFPGARLLPGQLLLLRWGGETICHLHFTPPLTRSFLCIQRFERGKNACHFCSCVVSWPGQCRVGQKCLYGKEVVQAQSIAALVQVDVKGSSNHSLLEGVNPNLHHCILHLRCRFRFQYTVHLPSLSAKFLVKHYLQSRKRFLKYKQCIYRIRPEPLLP